MDVTDETELWQRARQEDGSAFAQLFDLHHARIYGRALAMVGNVHEADDIAAAAFFELWRKHRSVPLVDGSVRPWLLVATVNLSHNSRGSAARYTNLYFDSLARASRLASRTARSASMLQVNWTVSHHEPWLLICAIQQSARQRACVE
jgi:DNA-directed RNA polymerase specialized sigma24 family protein